MTGTSNSNGYYALFAEARHALKCGYRFFFVINNQRGDSLSAVVPKFCDVKIRLDMIQWMCHIKALSITERRMTMSEKRKDNKGRILRTRESQRKDNPETA